MAAVTITTSTSQTSSPFFGLFFKRYMDKLNVTCGYPGLSFINTAKRAMDLLNIGIYGLAPKSNIQVGNELLMDEVIVKASEMKSVRVADRSMKHIFLWLFLFWSTICDAM